MSAVDITQWAMISVVTAIVLILSWGFLDLLGAVNLLLWFKETEMDKRDLERERGLRLLKKDEEQK